MKKYRISSILFVTLIVAILATSATVAAIIYISFTQNLTVPGVASFTAKINDEPITQAQDLTSLWNWDGSKFTITIVVHNSGTATGTPVISQVGLPSGWTFNTSTISPILAGADESVGLTVIPPNTDSGTSSGSFTIQIT